MPWYLKSLFTQGVFLRRCRRVAVARFLTNALSKWRHSHLVALQKKRATNASSSPRRHKTRLQKEARFLSKYGMRLTHSYLVRVLWRFEAWSAGLNASATFRQRYKFWILYCGFRSCSSLFGHFYYSSFLIWNFWKISIRFRILK